MNSSVNISIDTSLAILGFSSLDQATPDALRRAFATAIKESHPDRGGNNDMFDEILSAYSCLTSVLKRQSGGRDGLSCLDVKEVQDAREQQWIHELNNSVYDVLDSLSDQSAFQREFNEQFEKLHVSESKGYEAWLKEDEPVALLWPTKKEPIILENSEDMMLHLYQSYVSDLHSTKDDHQKDPTQHRQGVDPLFHSRFESQAPRVCTDLILHPDDMALSSGHGVALIEEDAPFHSAMHDRPEYSDLLSAYTSQHLLFDKLPVYSEHVSVLERMKTYQQERERTYDVLEDRDAMMIQAYEKKKEEEEAEHKRKITAYFQQTASSQWALRGSL